MDTQEKTLEFPRWMYGPKGEAGIFENIESVPEGWSDHQVSSEEGENEAVATASSKKTNNLKKGATSRVKPSSKKKSSISKKK